MINQLFTQTIDFDGTFLGKMQDGLLALGAAKQPAGTAIVGLTLLTHSRTAAHRAGMGHGEDRRIMLAFFQQHRHHLGNHIAGTPNDDGVADPHIFAAGLIFVVQRSIGDCHATDKDRREFCHRG